jgi:hypothetical protein
MMKLVPVMLAPLITLIIWQRHHSEKRGLILILRSLLLFGLPAIITFVAVDVLIEGGAFLRHFGQTWSSHFGAQQSFEYGSANEHPFDWMLLLKNWDSTIPGVLGLCLFVGTQFRARQISSASVPLFRADMQVLPSIWLPYSMFVFAVHKPWWAYYYIHLEVPLCWCAAVALIYIIRKGMARYATHKTRTVIGGFVLATVLFWTCGRVYFQIRSIQEAPRIYSDMVIPEMARFKPFAQWMYSDEPIYSFHAGIPFPPNLAVIMYKRLWSGDMTNEKLTAELGTVKPGLILLKQGTQVMPFQDLLEREYRLVYFDSAHRLYAHGSIGKKPGR